MSNFKFKLQKLLDIRVNEEEESKLFYSKAQNQKNIVENGYGIEKELEAKEIELEKAKKDFIDKRIKRRSLEVLKENKILEIKKEEERLEQISNDEFALYGYIRKTSNL